METLGQWLRAQPTLTGTPPPLDQASLPSDPVDLFVEWIRDAAAAGVAEPHAATLATVDAEGVPDARTLILKDVGQHGWAFAGHRRSRKGEQLAAQPAAALNFWWLPMTRAVRVRGPVSEANREESGADFDARSMAAREAVAREDWVLWRIVPTRVEFWQGSPDRRHQRIVYLAADSGWKRLALDGDDAEPAGAEATR